MKDIMKYYLQLITLVFCLFVSACSDDDETTTPVFPDLQKIECAVGDTKTLIVHPESTLAAHSTEQEKIDAAVFDDMIRISVGIEDIEDLKQDFTAAIQNTAG